MNKLTENQHVSLESMRGIAAITVALAHAVQFYIVRFYPDAFIYITFAAQSSVMVFFSMSGFLIGKSIQSNTEKNGVFKLSIYAESRFKRIYPPLILSILLVVIFSFIAPHVFDAFNALFSSEGKGTLGSKFNFQPAQILSILTFTNGILTPAIPFNQPLWSLPLEVWYYAIAGLLFTKKPLSILCAVVIFLCISSFKFGFLMYSLVWFSGLLASYAPPAKGFSKGLVMSIVVVLASLSIYFGFLFADKRITLEYYNASFGVFFTAFMYVFLVLYNKRMSLLNNTSKYSYTLYITHYPIFYFILGMFEVLVVDSLWVSLLVGVASLSFVLAFSFYISKIFENKRCIDVIM
ncbi:acyltransferase [Escherichia coli]|uniref:acyltransferase family protein n=1 Tax=Escherichia coli TaxID=562 RepID=UPI000BE3A323|nr:acyltransferase [Escherichia coli]EFE8249341.1 acyltransferase [Escherichia coli]EFN6064978.1 acyltransferase [Escherichia coli]EGM5574764.1 acyltransferase [Escherichia coli]ELF5009249.1 acyltransferase [Escherichia coli]MCO7952264.1 acyltransferase [Escherichia coli]